MGAIGGKNSSLLRCYRGLIWLGSNTLCPWRSWSWIDFGSNLQMILDFSISWTKTNQRSTLSWNSSQLSTWTDKCHNTCANLHRGMKNDILITIMCRNEDLSSSMIWVGCLLKDSELFILFAENSQPLLNISVIPLLLIFIYLVALNLLVNNQVNSLSNSTHHCGT